MIDLNLIAVVLSSAAAGALLSSVVNGLFNYRLKKADIKEQRLRMALDLTKLRIDTVIEAQRRSGRAVQLWDPAVMFADYLAALNEIATTGRWAKGDRIVAPYRSPEDADDPTEGK